MNKPTNKESTVTWQRERIHDGARAVWYYLLDADGKAVATVQPDHYLGGNFWKVTGSGITEKSFYGLAVAKANAEHRVATGDWATDTYGRQGQPVKV